MRSNSRVTFKPDVAPDAAPEYFIFGAKVSSFFLLLFHVNYSLSVVKRYNTPSGVSPAQNLFPSLVRFLDLQKTEVPSNSLFIYKKYASLFKTSSCEANGYNNDTLHLNNSHRGDFSNKIYLNH